MKHLPFLLLSLSLVACDQAPAPVEPQEQAAAPAQSAPPSPAPSEPAPAPVEEKPTPVAKPAPAAAPPRKKPEPAVKAPVELEPLVLDMRLPEELLEAIEPGEPLQLKPLLPPLFGGEIQSDYHVGGRLIESPDDERMFDGAELRLEIRR